MESGLGGWLGLGTRDDRCSGLGAGHTRAGDPLPGSWLPSPFVSLEDVWWHRRSGWRGWEMDPERNQATSSWESVLNVPQETSTAACWGSVW